MFEPAEMGTAEMVAMRQPAALRRGLDPDNYVSNATSRLGQIVRSHGHGQRQPH